MLGACQMGSPPDCADGNACTLDSCIAAAGGCVNVLIDRDGDGQAPDSLGACGHDCDDADPDVYGPPDSHADPCDGKDNDCDGRVDEDGPVTWYADCDGDGYAPMGATSRMGCAEPPRDGTGCPGGGGSWTTRAPTDARSIDCNDANRDVNPGQTEWQTEPIPGAPPASDFDYNCDGTEEMRWRNRGTCQNTPITRCLVRPGWLRAVPACGEEGLYLVGCVPAGGRCVAHTEVRTQACR